MSKLIHKLYADLKQLCAKSVHTYKCCGLKVTGNPTKDADCPKCIRKVILPGSNGKNSASYIYDSKLKIWINEWTQIASAKTYKKLNTLLKKAKTNKKSTLIHKAGVKWSVQSQYDVICNILEKLNLVIPTHWREHTNFGQDEINYLEMNELDTQFVTKYILYNIEKNEDTFNNLHTSIDNLKIWSNPLVN